MSEIKTHHEVEIGSERGFGIVFAVVFAIIGLWPLVFGSGTVRWWSMAVAAAFLAAAYLAPQLLAPLNRLWFKFGMLLGKVIAPLVMMLVFFIAVTPTALLARLFKKDFLLTGSGVKKQKSFWVERDQNPEHPPSMKNQF